jgi:DeoR/GlpR family transcriptional regulator of sugar metabolism
MVANARDLRHQQVLEILRERGKAGVAELRDRLGVTDMTIRRDLELLEADGALKRYHGGATLAVGSSYEPPFASREKTNAAAKGAIAAEVVSRISDGDTVLLDGGSTGLAVAMALSARSVTVCPLSLRAAWQLAKSTSVRLLIPGGTVRQGERSFTGAETAEYLQGHHFDHYILTASGMSVHGGFTEWNTEDAAVKRTAVGAAQQVIAAVDASKYGHVGFVKVCDIRRPDLIVTDATLGESRLGELVGAAGSVVTCPVEA